MAAPCILDDPLRDPRRQRALSADAAPAPQVVAPAPREARLSETTGRIAADTLSIPPVALVSPRLQRISLIVLVVLAFLAAAWVASALWAGLLLGVLTAFTIEPWNRYLLRLWPRRRSLAAATSVTITGLLCAGVIAGLSTILTEQLFDAVQASRDLARTFSPSSFLSPSVQRTLQSFGITPAVISDRLAHLSDRATEIVSGVVSVAVGSTFSVLGGLMLAFVTAYYTLKDQHPIERRLQGLLPLNPRITQELVDDFRKVGRGTLVGSVIAGVIQGILATVGYAIGGVPRALLLGVLTGVASFVPVFGTLLVWIPVSIGLLLTHNIGTGIFEVAWGVLVTSTLVDYVIRPMVVGRESRSHPLLFLIGVIGGVEVFGGVGILAGPIVMAFFASVLRIYRRDIVDGAHSTAA